MNLKTSMGILKVLRMRYYYLLIFVIMEIVTLICNHGKKLL